MDYLPTVVSGLGFLNALLLAVNGFLFSKLFGEIRAAITSTLRNDIEISAIKSQMADISRMREDVTTLKVVITNYLEHNNNKKVFRDHS